MRAAVPAPGPAARIVARTRRHRIAQARSGTPQPLPVPPSGNYLQWVMQKPQEVVAYLETVRAVKQLELVINFDGKTYKAPIQFSGENANITINIP